MTGSPDSSEGEARCERIAALTRELLSLLGEDPERDGLLRTPMRVAKSMQFLTRGYGSEIDDVLNGALFEVDYEEMVIVKDINFFSLCEHHMLPFYGMCHVAYLPKGKVLGLSKMPRIVDLFSRRLQVQERLTNQVAHAVAEAIEPHGVAVAIEAEHLCMKMRGVEKQNTVAITSCLLGAFQEPATRAEFLSLVHK